MHSVTIMLDLCTLICMFTSPLLFLFICSHTMTHVTCSIFFLSDSLFLFPRTNRMSASSRRSLCQWSLSCPLVVKIWTTAFVVPQTVTLLNPKSVCVCVCVCVCVMTWMDTCGLNVFSQSEWQSVLGGTQMFCTHMHLHIHTMQSFWPLSYIACTHCWTADTGR